VFIHPHVQFGIEPVTETPFRRVELKTADAQVGQDSVYRAGAHRFSPQLPFQMPEIRVNEGEAGVGRKRRLLRVSLRIFILIEGVQMAFAIEFFQYQPGVSAAAKCRVNVYSAGLHLQIPDCFGEKDTFVIHLILSYEFWVLGYEFWVLGYEFWVMSYEFWVMSYEYEDRNKF
jgi:hypothetical protein